MRYQNERRGEQTVAELTPMMQQYIETKEQYNHLPFALPSLIGTDDTIP